MGLARPQAGIGTYTRELTRAMSVARPGNPLTVYVPPGIGPAEEPPPGVAYREIPGPRLAGRHLLWPAQMRRRRFDAYLGAAGALPLGPKPCPSLITIHDLAIYRNREWFPPGQPVSTRLVTPWSIKRADAVIADSHNTSRDLEELFGVAPERISVIPLGVSARFKPLPKADVEPWRRSLGLPERFVLFVGTVEPRKNLETLLEAWAMLASRPPLVIAGGFGWRYEPIRERIERLGAGVRVLGWVEARWLPALYNLATCLAHPAWYEGFGLTPLEAMACGTPVIAADSSSLPEVVGDAALLAPPGDVEAWRRALDRMLADADLRAELRRKGILRAARFGWGRTAEATWELIEAVTAPTG